MAPPLVLTFLLALATGLVSLAYVSRRSHHHYSPVAEALVPPLLFYNLWILTRLVFRFADAHAFGPLPQVAERLLMAGLIWLAMAVVLQLGASYLAFTLQATRPVHPEPQLRLVRNGAAVAIAIAALITLVLLLLRLDPFIRYFARGVVALTFSGMALLSLGVCLRADQGPSGAPLRNLRVLGGAYFALFSVLTIFILWYRLSSALSQSTYVNITVALEVVFNLITVLWIKYFDRRVPSAPTSAPEASATKVTGGPLLDAYGISKREEEVVLLVCQGRTNQEIADALFISLKTVKDHNYRIFQKTGVRNRVELAQLVQKLASDGDTGQAADVPRLLPSAR